MKAWMIAALFLSVSSCCKIEEEEQKEEEHFAPQPGGETHFELPK
jgi:hypothetical protein